MAAFADPTDARATPDPVPDAATARQWLDAEERRLVTLLGQIRHDATASGDTGDATAAAITQHPADQATETFAREVDATLAADLTEELHEVAKPGSASMPVRSLRALPRADRAATTASKAMPARRCCLRREATAGSARNATWRTSPPRPGGAAPAPTRWPLTSTSSSSCCPTTRSTRSVPWKTAPRRAR
ncbi:MAG: hypothetical protein R2749_31545 [Acidimicrobiales bacterium]